MQNKEDEKVIKLYTLAELAYEKKFINSVNNVQQLYPKNWYNNSNYLEKIEILSAAIKENKVIEKSSAYEKIVKKLKRL